MSEDRSASEKPIIPFEATQILKAVAQKAGDGWKDPTKIGDTYFVWMQTLPIPFAPGQHRRIDNHVYSVSSDQFDLSPADPNEVTAFIEDLGHKVTAATSARDDYRRDNALLIKDRDEWKHLAIARASRIQELEQQLEHACWDAETAAFAEVIQAAAAVERHPENDTSDVRAVSAFVERFRARATLQAKPGLTEIPAPFAEPHGPAGQRAVDEKAADRQNQQGVADAADSRFGSTGGK